MSFSMMGSNGSNLRLGAKPSAREVLRQQVTEAQRKTVRAKQRSEEADRLVREANERALNAQEALARHEAEVQREKQRQAKTFLGRVRSFLTRKVV